MASKPKLVSIDRDDSAKWYRVSIDNGYVGTYPYVWLRDNCRCSDCFLSSAWQRAFLLTNLDPDVIPLSETLLDDGGVLRVTWPDQHRSNFDASWLNRQRFSDMEEDVVSNPELQTWGAEMNRNIPTFEFKKVLQEDRELYNWLNVLNTKGIALIRGAPTTKGTCRQLAEKIAYLRTTAYGEESDIVLKQDADNLAYTQKMLALHVDLPYYHNMPGIQLLHCVERTNVEGGENQFVDGFHVAEQVKTEFPETYKILTTTDIDFRNVGTIDNLPHHFKTSLPIIQCKKNGVYHRINCGDIVRAPYMSLPVEQITDVYRAIKLFNGVMYRPENSLGIQLDSGEIATFNNLRVLHDRSDYTIKGAGTRYIACGYIDWDEAHSRMRTLRETLFGEERL